MIKFKLLVSFLSFLSLTCFSQVGIGVKTPRATLDVNGNLKIRGTAPTSSSGNFTSLVVDRETREIKGIKYSLSNTYSMNYIVYNINNVDKDWIKNFNTKISATDYTLVVVGSSFDINLKPAAGGDYNSCNIYAFEQGGTWRISADYHDGTTYNGANGSWKVYCLAINKSIIKTIPPITVNMNRQPDRSAPNPPAGL